MKQHFLFAEIESAAIEHNCRLLRSFAQPGCRMCVAVKANAYGHGIDVVLPALERAGVDMVGAKGTHINESKPVNLKSNLP